MFEHVAVLGMFERFTDHARQCLALAEDEARRLGHSYVGTEHILLGLIREGDGVAAKALESLGVSLAAARGQVEDIRGQGQQTPSAHIPFSPRSKKVLELSLREGLRLGHSYIGAEHILLGLIREGEGGAEQVLAALGADLATVRQQVFHLLDGTVQVEPGHAADIPADQNVRNVAELADQVADARDMARRLWAHLPADVRKKLSDDSTSSIPPWVRDEDGT